jgi:hypothetical protein
MKNLIYSICIVILSWTLMASGCDTGGGGVTTYNAPSGGPKGGSSARFTIANNRLYTVDKQNLKIYDISNPSKMVYNNTEVIGNNIETIYPYRNNLYIASTNGMYQYSIVNPDKPSNKQFVQHVTGCDPVVANDSMAWLTVHGGTNCRGNINELQVFKVGQNFTSMQYLYNVPLSSPRGLGINNNYVYVCDYDNGIYIRHCTKINVSSIYKQAGKKFLDLIPYNNFLICQTTDGISYLDVSNPQVPELISEINL